MQLYRRLLALADIADRQVNVQSLLSDVTTPAASAPSTASGSAPSPSLPPTARQKEAFDLVFGSDQPCGDATTLPIDAAASAMGIQSGTVVSVSGRRCAALIEQYLIDGRFRTPPTDAPVATLLALLDARGDPFLNARYRKRLVDLQAAL